MIEVELCALLAVETLEQSVVNFGEWLFGAVVIFQVAVKLSNCKDPDQRILVVKIIANKSVVCA